MLLVSGSAIERRAKALLVNGNIQSVPSAGFGFYVPPL
ncbi:hypothetical protein COF04_10065 [Bacillus toyonensis]|nr:hypothetical protein CN540_30330 [Bacillus toyonensis]PFZ80291.1 hypothetical protein COL82_03800 [Bacillus toyonensis]PHC03964.1 hypothetical protein COF04_10065 [Bacillus toyonensis]